MKKKYIKGIILLAGLIFTLASCEDDRGSNPTLQTPAEFVLNTPAYAGSALYDLSNSPTVELTCSQPNYGFTAATVYSVQISLHDDFETEGKFMTLPSSYSTAKMNVDASELAVAVTTLALEDGKTEEDFPITSKVYVRLKAALTNNSGIIYSNAISLEKAYTKFALEPVFAPSTMNLIYADRKWDDCIEMVPKWGNPDSDEQATFWHIIYCDAGTRMKFNAEKGWDGSEFGSSAAFEDNAEAGLSDEGGHLKVENAGWYLVVTKSQVEGREIKNAVSFEKPNVYLTGEVGHNSEWGVFEENLFTIPDDGKGYFVSPPFSTTGEVRMCVVLDPDNIWHSEFIVFADGVIAYRGTEGDQERYVQGEGKQAYLNFMTGKGYYE